MQEPLRIIGAHHGLSTLVRIPAAEFRNRSNDVNIFSIHRVRIHMEDNLIGVARQDCIQEFIADLCSFGYGNHVLSSRCCNRNDCLDHGVGSGNNGRNCVTKLNSWIATQPLTINIDGIPGSAHGGDYITNAGGAGVHIRIVGPHTDLSTAQSKALDIATAHGRALAVKQTTQYIGIGAVGKRSGQCRDGGGLIGLPINCNDDLFGIELSGVDNDIGRGSKNRGEAGRSNNTAV